MWLNMRKEMVAVNGLVLLVLYMLRPGNADHNPEYMTPPTVTSNQDLMEYTLFDYGLSWNDAAKVCASRNSHLLTLQSQAKVDLVEHFKLDMWKSLLSNDYWSGLSEPTPYFYIWEDCTVLSTGVFQMFKGESYNSGELCYKVKKDDLKWESKKCDEKHFFACERVRQGECDEVNILSSNNLAKISNSSIESCKANCTQRNNCWSGIFTDGQCILLVNRIGSESLTDVTMFKKSCVKVSVVHSGVVPNPSPEDKSQIPKVNCSSVPTVPPGVVTPDTTSEPDISPSPCFVYSTVNVSNIYNVTETVNITQTVIITQSINATSSIVLTNTVNITDTFIATQYTTATNIYSTLVPIMSTTTVTATHNVTEYHIIRSTLYDSLCSATCFNRTTNYYLSTDDPLLLEAISSIKKELMVDRKGTSYYKRKLISSHDTRASAKAIGLAGIMFFVVPLCLIVLADVTSLLRRCDRLSSVVAKKTLVEITELTTCNFLC